MREILFRGKRKDNGEWVEGYFCGKYNETFFSPAKESAQIIDKDLYWHEVVPETVGQYTGLTDKNGKKIFEGDIIKTNKFREPNKQYIVKFDFQFGAFIGHDKYNMYFVTFDGDSDQFEIIGNIHDTP